MAKVGGALNERGVKDWFAGLSFEVQEKVLGDLSASFELSKEDRIAVLEREISALRGSGSAGTAAKAKNGAVGRRRGRRAATVVTARPTQKGQRGAVKGVKVPPKYADGKGNTWAGRGVHPHWIRDYLKKRGNKIDDLLIKK